MPAAKKQVKKARDPEITKLGVIAGGGSLPGRLLAACDEKGIDAFVIAFDGHTDPRLVRDHNHIWTRLGAAGQILNTLRAHDIKDLVLIGSIRRPTLAELRPDLKTTQFFAKLGLKALGDGDLLDALRSFLEKEGFRIHGIQNFAENLLAPAGAVGKHKPKKADWIDINHGLRMSQELGRMDIGQSVIVQEGIVLGVEAAEGTDELIRRCRHLHKKGRKGVLVKTCKPQQDHDLDLPTIGPETIKAVATCGFGGIAVQEGASLILDPQEVAHLADEYKIYVIGLTADEIKRAVKP